MQNVASRLYRSHRAPVDRAVFDSYVALLASLAAVWRDYDNVIALETMA